MKCRGCGTESRQAQINNLAQKFEAERSKSAELERDYLELIRQLVEKNNEQGAEIIQLRFDKQDLETKVFSAIDEVWDKCDYIETPDSSLFCQQLKNKIRECLIQEDKK